MKILFIGLGSIGQRHLRIIKKLYKKYKIYYLKVSKSNIIINDDLVGKKVSSISEYYNITEISIFQLKNISFDLTFITNPISLHVKYALKMAKLGSNLFIEKPLSNNLNKINELIKISKKNKIKIYVGYHLRFHPGIIKIKDLISTKQLGVPISGLFYFGEYLPMTRTYVDYSKTHMASKRLGGGAALCLSHQIDLCIYLLKDIKLEYASLYKKSKLKINTEDVCKLILKDKNNSSFSIILNFLDNPANNFIKLNFQKGYIKWDYVNKSLLIENYHKKKPTIFSYKKISRNNIFEKQIKFIFNDLKKPHKLNQSFFDSITCLKIIKKAKEY